MRTILLIEPLPLIRHSIGAILSEGQAGCRVLGMDIPDPAQSPPSHPEAIDLAIISAGVRQHRTEIINWLQQHHRPPAILMIVDAQNPPALATLPLTVTCVSNEITPEVLRALVGLLLAGGTYSRLHPRFCQPASADTWQTSDETRSAIGHIEESELLGLTPRQYEVLVLLSKGYPIKTVGRTMNISAATAKAHAEALYQRLDVNSRNAAVYKAILRGATLGWTMAKVRSMVSQDRENLESSRGRWDVSVPPGGLQMTDDAVPPHGPRLPAGQQAA
ncbi:LuxR C-terminal-related transcriptional regulator [Castellaniella sp. GW247-6E4]|uniref:LuxR C-terminal-related transcriptional regulator n=1 Tax=Castellaniella sp. GW247-6E4 TaxID=3140380 RepID=UPI0033159D11